MKSTHYISIVLVGIVTLQMIPLVNASAEWSESFSTTTYNWKAITSQLRDNGLYYDWDLVGSICLPGGGIRVKVNSIPSNDFNFFEGDRLDFWVTVEGDMVITPGNFTSDYHLLILPVAFNGTNSFKLLFEQTELLENLTHSVYVNSSISSNKAVLYLKYNGILDVSYEWDTTTGLLMKKSVISPSELKLIVIPGIGSGFVSIPTYYPLIIYLSVIIGILIILKKRFNKKRMSILPQ